MKIEQYDIWLANLNSQRGTEPGKTRPVVVIQTNLLNGELPSTIICPITTKVQKNMDVLRIHLNKKQLNDLSDVLVDQIRAIDNKRLISRLGELSKEQQKKLKENIKIVLDLE
ncbi:type II toxin-antitoxin system PemK/MazF family toxin [Pelobium manganitolerans]|uniref:type II toxin-antitoxin system PemK/MazF family toxin n=1 Tax=Pelobium manganitolerans TaxID=1842495 RepID=UPI003FA3CBF5